MPLVTVSITTYNHEKYIRRTIESVFEQECNFPVEVVICNDASTDNTHEIILDAIKGHKNVKYIKQEKNVGISLNFIDSLINASGKYIAVLDGDDFWIDKNKLQLQVDFLDQHDNYIACFTDSVMFWGDDIPAYGALKDRHKRNLALSNLDEGGIWIPTSTFMYKRSIINDTLPEEYRNIRMVDIFLFYLVMSKGDIGYINKVTSAYRKHHDGIWSGLNELEQINFRLANFEKMKEYFSDNTILYRHFSKTVSEAKRLKLNYRLRTYFHALRKGLSK